MKTAEERTDERDALIIAFVQGAQWWEFHKTGATMWARDRNDAEEEAGKREAGGTLGKLQKPET